MTVIFSKKCELALQAALFLSAKQAGDMYNAESIAKHLKAPKEFVSKVLQSLTSSGIIDSKKGKNGGFFLAKKPAEIKLIDIVMTIDGLEVFHKCVLGFKGCSLEKPCPVHDKWGVLRDQTYKMLSSETLADLRDKAISKIDSL